MMFWLAAALLTAAVLLLVVRPLIRKPPVGSERADHDREVYRDQLEELERELARGTVTPDQYAAAKAEIGRRILSTAEQPLAKMPNRARGGAVAAGLVIGIPLSALAVYLALGSPGLPSQPFAAREQQRDAPHAIVQAVAKLTRHLEQEPDDVEGWRLLGETYKRIGRLRDSVAALRRTAALAPEDAEIRSSLGEALVWAEQGIVGEEARQVFEAALKTDPNEPRARYYLALSRAQSGDVREALDGWVTLARDAAADAPWLPNVREQIAEAARQLNLNVVDLLPAADARPGPDGQAMEAARSMTPEQRAEMIRGMVDGLAARLKDNPGDLEGWLRLGRSYTVLGERRLAADAFKRAAGLAPRRADVLTALLGQLDPQSPDYAEVQRQLDALNQGG